MEREKILLLRNILLRAFLIGVIFAVLFFVLTLAFWSTWTSLVEHWFKIDEKELGRIAVLFFTQIRIVLIFFFLVPALALHWTAKKQP
jgi:hypothetical protein